MNFFIKRIREPSTWAAIAALLVAVGVPGGVVALIGPGLDILTTIGQIGAPVAAVVAAVLPEGQNDNYGG